MSRWLNESRAFIAKLDRDIPAEADWKQRRKVLRENGWRVHGGTYWGRKQWGKAVREYLARHGGPPLPTKPIQAAPNFGPDIIFPFRSPQP
jgi:hypothetical protein